MKLSLNGIITPVVTVFDNDENIDESGYRRIISYLISHGVDGIFVCGGQGEGFSLSGDEKIQCLEIALDESAGRVPVLAGTGAVTTREAVSLTKRAEQSGADAAVLITPYFINPTQKELYEHYLSVLEACELPVLIYDNPWRTHLSIDPSTVSLLSTIAENLAGIKDSSGDLARTLAFKRHTHDGFKVYIGRDQLILAGLVMGLDGAVAATSNAAVDIITGIYREWKEGNISKAREYQETLVPLREFFSKATFPVVVKEAMNMQGLKAGECRRPVLPMDNDTREQLERVLHTMGLTGGQNEKGES
jgi:4-hydroxy-tetrahydrodipicolinate synthase